MRAAIVRVVFTVAHNGIPTFARAPTLAGWTLLQWAADDSKGAPSHAEALACAEHADLFAVPPARNRSGLFGELVPVPLERHPEVAQRLRTRLVRTLQLPQSVLPRPGMRVPPAPMQL